MKKNKSIQFDQKDIKFILKALDIIAILLAISVFGFCFEFSYLRLSLDLFSEICLLIFYFFVFGTIFEIYDLSKAHRFDFVLQSTLLTSLTSCSIFLFTPILSPSIPKNRIEIIVFYIMIFGSVFTFRYLFSLIFSKSPFKRRYVLIGDGLKIKDILSEFNSINQFYELKGLVNTNNNFENSNSKIDFIPQEQLIEFCDNEKVSEIIIYESDSFKIEAFLKFNLLELLNKKITVKNFNTSYEENLNKLPLSYMGQDFYNYFPLNKNQANKLYQFFNRGFDIVFSLLLLIFTFCISPIIVIANFFGNKGSLFFKQERVGKNGKLFDVYKFRTMVSNAEINGAQWASENDSRITPFGAFLRKSRLDELPQLINVLMGDMAVIGPRPERPIFVKELNNQLSFYEFRHIVKPGLTGWAQVNERYGTNIIEDSFTKLQYDLFYIKHQSFTLDVNVIFKTISTIIYYRGQ